MLLGGRPQLGRGGAGSGVGVPPGLLLGGAGLGERGAGPFGLGERVGDVGGAGGGGELGAALAEPGFGRGQVVPGPEGFGAAPLPVGEMPCLALPVERPVEVLAAGGDLAPAGFRGRGRGLGELRGPLRRGQRTALPGESPPGESVPGESGPAQSPPGDRRPAGGRRRPGRSGRAARRSRARPPGPRPRWPCGGGRATPRPRGTGRCRTAAAVAWPCRRRRHAGIARTRPAAAARPGRTGRRTFPSGRRSRRPPRPSGWRRRARIRR